MFCITIFFFHIGLQGNYTGLAEGSLSQEETICTVVVEDNVLRHRLCPREDKLTVGAYGKLFCPMDDSELAFQEPYTSTHTTQVLLCR